MHWSFNLTIRFAVFLNTFTFRGMVIVAAAMGFIRTWLHVPVSLTFAEHLPKER